MGDATKAFLRLLAQYGQDSGWAPRWFFYWSQAAKLNAALMEGNYKKVVAVRRHYLRTRHRGRAAMAATGEARWPPGLHGEGGVHEQPLGDVVGQQQQHQQQHQHQQRRRRRLPRKIHAL